MRKTFVVCVAVALLAVGAWLAIEMTEGDWGGVDESVVEHYAEEAGRSARDPYINTDQGDLLLFVFLLAGACGGFVAGDSFKTLFSRKRGPSAT